MAPMAAPRMHFFIVVTSLNVSFAWTASAVAGKSCHFSGVYSRKFQGNDCGNPWSEPIEAGTRRLGELVRIHAEAGWAPGR
jgi:hypothetical protein